MFKNEKNNKLIYWGFTIILAVGMSISAFNQLSGNVEQEAEMMRLGYPDYFSSILGVAKIFGVVVILIPKKPIIKEWAYAGFAFIILAAIFSHFSVGEDSLVNSIPASLFGIFIFISWYSRPEGRSLK